jgi:hypothetical protein
MGDDFKLTSPDEKNPKRIVDDVDRAGLHSIPMGYSFTKLFSTITRSTIWCEDSDTRVLWVTMLALADRKGRVLSSIPGLAKDAAIPLEVAERAIRKFEAPDPYSRSNQRDPESAGRRIRPIDGGWELINYDYYRNLRDEETEREKKRNWIRQRRLNESTVDHGRPQATEAEAESFVQPQAVELAKKLRELILENNPSAKIGDAQVSTWEKQAEQMLRLDNRQFNDAMSLLEWSQHDSFWCSNILSMQKFRKQYDQLSMKRKNGGHSGRGGTIHYADDRAQIKRVIGQP